MAPRDVDIHYFRSLALRGDRAAGLLVSAYDLAQQGARSTSFSSHVTRTIYVRPTGSDTAGTGASSSPFKTLVRAVTEVPVEIEPGIKYIIDVTGINETLPQDFTLPSWKSWFTTDSLVVADPYFLFNAAVVIQATPQMAALSPAADADIASSDIASQTFNSVSGLLTITLTTPRASWGSNALKGMFLVDNVGGNANAVIWSSTTTTIVVCTAAAMAAPMRIMTTGATITGSSSSNTVATGSARGALRAVNIDSIGFAGLYIKNSGGVNAPGLVSGGQGAVWAQMCRLESPSLQSNSPALNRCVRCYITGTPSFSNFVTIQSSLCEGWLGSPLVNLQWFLARRTVFDGCVTLEPKTFFPGSNVVGLPVSMFYLQEVAVCNTPGATGDGIRLHGSQAQLTKVDVYACGRDGIRFDLGHGWASLIGCGTSGADNAGVGLRVDDGMMVKVDTTTSANANVLTGTGGDMIVGTGAARTWANFISGGGGRPALNEYDITVAASTGATGTGSRVYQ